MPDIDDVRTYLASETGLAVVSTTQADGRVLSSAVNCGVVAHPPTGQPVVLATAGFETTIKMRCVAMSSSFIR